MSIVSRLCRFLEFYKETPKKYKAHRVRRKRPFMKKIFRKQLICSITSILLLLGLLGGKVLPETNPNDGIQTLGFSGPGSSQETLKPNPTDSDGDVA